MHRVLEHSAEGRDLVRMRQVRGAVREVGGGQDCRIWTKFNFKDTIRVFNFADFISIK